MFFSGLTLKVVGLALHGTKTAHLPVELQNSLLAYMSLEYVTQIFKIITYPGHHLPVLRRVARVRNLVVLDVAVDKVLENGTALKDANGLAIRPLVGDGGDAAVGVNLEEPRLLLLILAHLDGMDLQEGGNRGRLAWAAVWRSNAFSAQSAELTL